MDRGTTNNTSLGSRDITTILDIKFPLNITKLKLFNNLLTSVQGCPQTVVWLRCSHQIV